MCHRLPYVRGCQYVLHDHEESGSEPARLPTLNPAQLAEAKSLTTVGVAAAPKGVSPQIATTIADDTHATFISGMTAAFLVASVVAVGGALVALLTKKGSAAAH